MPRFSSSKAVTAPLLGSMLGPNKSSLLEVTGAVNSLGCYAFAHFWLTITQIDALFYLVNNNCIAFMNSSLKSRTSKTSMPIWLPENLLGSARPVGGLVNTYEAARTMPGRLNGLLLLQSLYHLFELGFRQVIPIFPA